MKQLDTAAEKMAQVKIDGIKIATPLQESETHVLFDKLGSDFAIDEMIITYITVTLGAKSLNDFARLFSDFREVKEVIEKATGVAKEVMPMQVSTVRQAWESVTDAKKAAQELKRRGLESDDMEELLPR